MQEILKKLRKYEIKIRKAIKDQMQGDFHSIFKGSGLEFDDVRTYQYGDDVRTIDWNVTAKGHGTYVKTFKEEKEQTVYFILDVSASQNLGPKKHRKYDISREICGVLTLSAIKESTQVGLICYSDRKEKFVKPGKGLSHATQLIHAMFKLKPKSQNTNLAGAMLYSLGMIKKRSIVILVSDFIDENYMHNLKALAGKHDLVVIHIFDPRESRMPRLGIVPLIDEETGKRIWVNSSSGAFRKTLHRDFAANQEEIEDLCRKMNASYVSISTQEDYVPKLIKLFKVRNASKRSA